MGSLISYFFYKKCDQCGKKFDYTAKYPTCLECVFSEINISAKLLTDEDIINIEKKEPVSHEPEKKEQVSQQERQNTKKTCIYYI